MRRVAALLLVLTLTACAEKAKAPTAAQLAHRTYVDKVNAICAKYDRLGQSIPQPKDDTSPTEVRAFLRRAIPWAERWRREVKAVVPPAHERAEVAERLWAPMDDLVKRMHDLSANVDRALRSHSQADVQRVENAAKALGDNITGSEGWLDDFGLTACS